MPEHSTGRRTFLKHSSHLALASAIAMNFGCAIAPQIKEDEQVALIYGTRYGATRETAYWISRGMKRRVDILNIEEISFEEAAKKYDKLIIGSGIWVDGAHAKLVEFLMTQKAEINNKIVAAFIVCGTTGEDKNGQERIAQYFGRFLAPLEKKPPLHAHFGGRMIIEKLSERDRALLDNFYRNVLKREFASWDRTQPKEAAAFGEKTAGALN